jgi:hypothetical protein
VKRGYRTPAEHLDDAIGLVTKIVERQIVAHWEAGILPRIHDQFSGTFVSRGEVDALLTGGLAVTADAARRIADLDAGIVASELNIEERTASSHRQGAPMPFDRLRRALGLSAAEQRALWVTIVCEVRA